MKYFGTVRPKNFDGKTWYPLLWINFFDTPSFLKHWRDAHEFFRYCETWKFRLKIVICHLKSINFFYTRNFLENGRGPLQRFLFRSCETKNFDKIVMPPFLCMKVFDKRFFLKRESVLQWNILVQSDQNIFDGKLW